MLLEPRFAAPDMYQELNGAQDTILVPARQTPYGIDTFTSEEWKQQRMDWPNVLSAARRHAAKLEQSMEIKWQRDDRRVLQYAMIVSESPFISSVIFSPGFTGHFEKNLGKELLVVVPDRYSVFVFPRYGGTLEDFGPALVRRYQDAAVKVSLEVFLVDAEGPRAIGKLGK